ncbi:hypothetical protein ABZ297_24885 [Nonomuraea sp. NPDC005983]|uniref:hypothetical protein n=1 Tax=Nonomuraea sp. NPDC005983 TaxID=3155595 RepID=UPI0033A67E1B
MARSIYPSVELGKLIAAQVKRQNMSFDILAERATAPMDLLPPALSGEGKRCPWQFYERIFKALETDRSITQQARRYWEMWRDGESGIHPWFENNRVHRLRADLPGYDLQPDPMRASSKEEFLAVMREFHVWAGEPSFREIARNAGKTVGASTLCEALDANRPPRLPTLKVVMAFIHGCGGSEDDLVTWTTAWRRVRMARATAGTVTPLRAGGQRNVS